MAKNNYFKLGEKATLFVDPQTQKKIVGNQVVEFTDAQQGTELFRIAKKNGHIEAAGEDDMENLVESTEEGTSAPATKKTKVTPKEYNLTEDQAALVKTFSALKVDERKTFILDEYELAEADEADLELMKGDQLIEKYKELLTTIG